MYAELRLNIFFFCLLPYFFVLMLLVYLRFMIQFFKFFYRHCSYTLFAIHSWSYLAPVELGEGSRRKKESGRERERERERERVSTSTFYFV